MKINYVIASYEGIINKREKDSEAESALNLQIQILYKILKNKKSINNIAQITVMCPIVTGPCHKNYYQKDMWLKQFKEINIPIVFESCTNYFMSYDQWLMAYEKYPNFDYYILIEDDYCIYPEIDDFDIELINFYKYKYPNNIGYLCTWAPNSYGGHSLHAAISNGIVSRETFEKIGKSPLNKFYNINDNNFSDKSGQLKFSYLFLSNGCNIVDFKEKWRLLFWSSHQQNLVDFSDPNILKYIIVPVQFLYKNFAI